MATTANVTPSGKRPPDYEALRKKLDNELQIGIKHRNRYIAAALLALYWEAADDEGYHKEATDVVDFFRDKLHYNAEAFPIPSNKS